MIYRTDYESPLGRVTLASDGESIVGLWLEGQKYFGDTVNGEMHREDRLAIFAKTRDVSGRKCGRSCAISLTEKS